MTLSVLLIAYIIVVLGFLVYALFNLFHIMRFGRMDAATYFMTAAFVAGFAFILFVSYTFIDNIDFSQRLFVLPANNLQTNTINTGF